MRTERVTSWRGGAGVGGWGGGAVRYTINIMNIGRFCNEDTARPTRMITVRIKTRATADYFDLFSDRSRQISDGIEGGGRNEGRKRQEGRKRRLKRRKRKKGGGGWRGGEMKEGGEGRKRKEKEVKEEGGGGGGWRGGGRKEEEEGRKEGRRMKEARRRRRKEGRWGS